MWHIMLCDPGHGLLALASLIIFPEISDMKAAFPHLSDSTLNDDLAYSAMLTYLPAGLMGIVLASLIAAFMSTISTHLNWGSSYVVNDFYLRFVKPEASDKEQVMVGRISTVVLMVFAGVFALALSNALQAFAILLQIGAGTGLIFILRWFWWRINAYTEISAMIVSFIVAVYFEVAHEALGFEPILSHWKLLMGVGITTASWLIVTFLTAPERDEVLLAFYRKVRPAAYGWNKVLKRYPEEKAELGRLPFEIGLMLIASIMVYTALFATGFWIYGNVLAGTITTIISIICGVIIFRGWEKLNS